ncbi:disease resistance protein RPP13-like [Magnolia sinica]|uniref:disease resistance protein RPP13-like n=1 Tax=Magnolia sinica TaxID=86752 RepID=UPI002658713C|nr:disease resistance protein RPP13-like [Magnolia sinica]
MDFLTQEAYFLQGVHERVTSLQEKLEDIRDLFNDIDGKCRKNDAVKRWMGEIREVASDAEDVIDSYNFKIEKRQGDDSARFMGSVRSFACGVKDIPATLQVGKKISDIERRLDEILSNRSVYGIDNIPAYGEASSSSSSSNQSHTWREKRAPIVEEADVVGVEDETEKLVRQLTEGDVRRAVISITGMGGIGKTTLAKKVYDDKNVKKTFKFHAWVYVSQEYQVRELLLSIIKCFQGLSRGKWEMMIEEDLQKVVSEYLEGKKYLVVIDDIWTRDAWDGLVSAFPDGKNGSRVLLTTRNEDIAREVGERMVAKCGGLPLAITVLGGVLSRKDNYHDLPYDLTPCFLYLGAFPEDSEIDVAELIRLWIAEGFVQKRGGEEMEDVAEDYMNELISRSMIQVSKRKSNGTAEKCRIHDLLRSLSIAKAKEERFLDVNGAQRLHHGQKHANLYDIYCYHMVVESIATRHSIA